MYFYILAKLRKGMCACVSNVNNAVNGRKQGNTLFDYDNILLS